MQKTEFLSLLRMRLMGLPEEDIIRSLDYYSEIIEDLMEDGFSEEEAVASLGSVDEIVAQILMEIPLPKLVQEKIRPKRALKAWEIALLILGSPIWVPLLLAGIIVMLALYLVLWAIIVVLYAVDLSFAASAVAGAIMFFACLASGHVPQGVFSFGLALTCAGLAILLFFAFNRFTKGILRLSKRAMLSMKSAFIGREATL